MNRPSSLSVGYLIQPRAGVRKPQNKISPHPPGQCAIEIETAVGAFPDALVQSGKWFVLTAELEHVPAFGHRQRVRKPPVMIVHPHSASDGVKGAVVREIHPGEALRAQALRVDALESYFGDRLVSKRRGKVIHRLAIVGFLLVHPDTKRIHHVW